MLNRFIELINSKLQLDTKKNVIIVDHPQWLDMKEYFEGKKEIPFKKDLVSLKRRRIEHLLLSLQGNKMWQIPISIGAKVAH